MRVATTYVVGLMFGIGIALSGMANPAKVLNFFDVFGTWDPSLLFVMGGAVVTTFIGCRLVLSRQTPLLETSFTLPTSKNIDPRLVLGSALFGIGWGIAGFCPGGALSAIGTGRVEVMVFVAGLLVGLIAARLMLAKGANPPTVRAETQS